MSKQEKIDTLSSILIGLFSAIGTITWLFIGAWLYFGIQTRYYLSYWDYETQMNVNSLLGFILWLIASLTILFLCVLMWWSSEETEEETEVESE